MVTMIMVTASRGLASRRVALFRSTAFRFASLLQHAAPGTVCVQHVCNSRRVGEIRIGLKLVVQSQKKAPSAIDKQYLWCRGGLPQSRSRFVSLVGSDTFGFQHVHLNFRENRLARGSWFSGKSRLPLHCAAVLLGHLVT